MLSSFSPPILAAIPDLSSMADKKISTINLEVDLDCSCCFKKITETLEKYPEIQIQILNREKKTVTISGPFDPEKLMKCICCKAGKYIKSYEIFQPKPLVEPTRNPDTEPKPKSPKPKPIKRTPKPITPTPIPEPTIPDPKPVCCSQCSEGQRGPDPKPVCCRQCSEGQRGGPCWHPCPAPMRVCLCFEGYEAGLYSSPYAPPFGCRGKESTCRTM